MSNLATVDLNFMAVAPLITLAVAALLVLILDLVLPADRSRPWLYAAGVGGVLVALLYTYQLWWGPAAGPAASVVGAGALGRLSTGIAAFGGHYVLDRFTLIFHALVLIAVLCALLIERAPAGRGEVGLPRAAPRRRPGDGGAGRGGKLFHAVSRP